MGVFLVYVLYYESDVLRKKERKKGRKKERKKEKKETDKEKRQKTTSTSWL